MRVSSYVADLALQHPPRTFLIQGAAGALDVAAPDLVDRLRRLPPDASSGDCEALFGAELARTLQDRGYLTELTENEESRRVERLLAVYAAKIRARFAFRLLLRSDAIRDDTGEVVDGFYALVDELFGGRAGNRELATATLDLGACTGTPDDLLRGVVEDVLERATLSELDVIVELPAERLLVVRDSFASNYLIRINAVVGRFATCADELIAFSEHAISCGKEITWLLRADEMSPAEVAMAFTSGEAIRGRLPPSDQRLVQNLLIVPLLEPVHSTYTPERVSRDDLGILDGLHAHAAPSTLRAGVLTFRPVTLPPLAHVTYDAPGRLSVKIGDFGSRWDVDTPDSLSEIIAAQAGTIRGWLEAGARTRVEVGSRCGTRCPYALICDNECRPLGESVPAASGAIQPCGDFPARIRRVLPTLLANALAATSAPRRGPDRVGKTGVS